jgi:hypothetical protein
MEDVLAVYTRPRDPDCPLVCLDETSKSAFTDIRYATNSSQAIQATATAK